MGFRHNNQLPNNHFRKDWQRRVKTWFNQPGRKTRRRLARAEKAAKIAPRPVDGLLRPAVRSQTFKYNTKLRAGRGFSLDELKEAGINRKLARTIGIAVDHRRRNKSVEGLQLNVQRLKAYQSKLVVFPKKAGKPQKGDTTDKALLEKAAQLTGALFPVQRLPAAEAPRAITAAEKSFSAYSTLRKAFIDAKYVGVREKRAKERAEEAEAAAQK